MQESEHELTHPGPAKRGQSEEEKAADAPICIHCGGKRTLLHLEPKRNTTLRACINKKCFKFVSISSLQTWKP